MLFVSRYHIKWACWIKISNRESGIRNRGSRQMKLDHICQAMKKANIYPNFIQPILPYIRDWYHLQVHEPGILSLTTYFHVKAIGTNIYRYICPSTKPFFIYHTSIIMSRNEESEIKPAGPYTHIPHFTKVVKNKKKN